MRKVYLKDSALEAALKRIRWVFDEFPNVVVGTSGGKDSTAVLRLALCVAEEKGRLPLKVMFVDQEAEWQSVIDYQRQTLADPRIEPYWIQVHLVMSNATSTDQDYLQVWDPENPDDWIRPKEPGAIHENVYGTKTFHQFFEAFARHHFPDEPMAYLSGVRAEEAKMRAHGMTQARTYKWVTWGKRLNETRGHYTFYPLYDWSYVDVWKAIHDHGWPYSKIYDWQYQYGMPIKEMRVSNVHHADAVKNLFYMQEVEPETWNRITERLHGVNTAGQMQQSFFMPKDHPPAFKSWREYRDFLLPRLIASEDRQAFLRRKFDLQEGSILPVAHEKMCKFHVKAILTNDPEVCLNQAAMLLAEWSMNYGKKRFARKKEGRKHDY